MSSRWKERNVKKKIHAIARKVLYHAIPNLSGLVAMNEERLMTIARNSAGEKEEQKEE